MKKLLVLLSMMLVASFTEISAQENAKIVIIRDSGLMYSIVAFPTFLNENHVEKISNRTSSTLIVPAGENTLSFRYVGKKKPWKHAEKITLNLQPGETKYIMPTQVQRPFKMFILPLEITEATAKRFPQPLNFTLDVTQNK